MKKRYRIVSKFRFTVFICLLVIFAGYSVNMVAGSNEASSMSEPAYTEIQIQAGDTLWDLASQVGPENCDVRQVVFEICKLNDIKAGNIHPGQSLLVPVSI